MEYEYNEYAVGYVVTAGEHSVNFQFEKVFSNHPQPAYRLKFGCAGDDTWRGVDEELLADMEDFLRRQHGVRALEAAYTEAMHSEIGRERLENILAMCGRITEDDIFHACDNE